MAMLPVQSQLYMMIVLFIDDKKHAKTVKLET